MMSLQESIAFASGRGKRQFVGCPCGEKGCGESCRRWGEASKLARLTRPTLGGGHVDMLPIKGLYEVAIRVRDLARAEAFYKDVLGLKEGLRDDRRNWLFLYVGGDAGMVVLQEDKGEWPTQHFAFTVSEPDIKQAAAMLKEKGVSVSEPVYHEWMNSVSVYFDDPRRPRIGTPGALGSLKRLESAGAGQVALAFESCH